MKKLTPFLILILLAATAIAQASEKKAILFMLDGCRADAVLSGNTPNLKSLCDGSWAEGYKGSYSYAAYTSLDAPPSSATNHVAILTGVTATKNGCYENGQTASAKYDEYPTISTMISGEYPDLKSAWLYNWGEDGDIQTNASYIGPPQNDEKNFDAIVQLLNGTYPTQDGVQETKWTEGDDIDLIMAYIDELDGNGHGHGFTVTCPEYMNYMDEVDQQIGRVLAAIKARPHFANEDWLIVINSDHGGYHRSHGIVGSTNCYTIPLIVSGKNIPEGRMKGDPCNRDAAAYIMMHFTGKIPEYFDAKINDAAPDKPLPLTENLLAYFPFEGNVDPAVGDFSGQEGLLPAEYAADGIIGKALTLTGTNPVCFGQPNALKFGADRDFTFAFWFRTDKVQKGSAALLGNKPWNDCFKSGIVVTANVLSDEGNKLEYNLGDAVHHHDINPLEYDPDGQWHFAAVTADRDGDAILYLGFPDGKLAFIAERMGEFGSIDNMDWFLGQDGTASADPYVGDLDELMIWDRALTNEELYKLFRQGLDGKTVQQ